METLEIKKMFEVFGNKKVLVTGDSGFKGSWLAIWLLELGAEVYGYSLPPKSKTDNFLTCGLIDKIQHFDGDVRNYSQLQKVFFDVQPDFAFHLAAQSLVLASYHNPIETFETNLMGTVNFFEAVRSTSSVRSAINVTSDKCYDNKEWIWGYRENDPMGGSDPYSASKGCAELITSSYLKSFFEPEDTCNVASVRAGNVIGGGDWSENRIIPDFYRARINNEILELRNPNATRPWQFVLEPLRGYLNLAAGLYNQFGQSKSLQGGWNFGPEDENNVSVVQLIKSLIEVNGKGKYVSKAHNFNLKESSLLKLDISKAKKYLNWKPSLTFKETVAYTVEGYEVDLNGSSDSYNSRVKQIQAFTKRSSDLNE